MINEVRQIDHCPRDGKRYAAEGQARQALAAKRRRVLPRGQEWYLAQCLDCDGWHLLRTHPLPQQPESEADPQGEEQL